VSTQEPASFARAFMKWIPLAKQVVQRTLGLGWKDVLEVYSYLPTVALAEALALEARRAGSDTHITLMTDDLWFTSMEDLPTRWLREPSQVELAINETVTAHVYLGGPADARRFSSIPLDKFDANAIGNLKQDEPRQRRRVRQVDLPIGRVCQERAEAYSLDYPRWRRSYEAALAVDLDDIRKAGLEWAQKLKGRKKVRITSNSGTDVRFETKDIAPFVDDGIIDAKDVRSGHLETGLPAGKVVSAVLSNSAEGEVHFAEPFLLAGKVIRGVSLVFEKGRLVCWEAKEHADLLSHPLRNVAKMGGDRLGWFAIGLNPVAEPCMLDNRIVKDDVTIGLGYHPQMEPSKERTAAGFEATIGICNVEIYS
jgi:leucyl aminopeptidase (aminopeptidase T)